MKNIILSLLLMASAAFAADAPKDKYYGSGFSIESFYSTVTSDFENERGSAGIGVSYFLTDNFGVGASTSVGNLNGPLIDNVSLRGIYRVPINQTAIYGYGGSTRLLKAEEWTIDLGVGVEHRFVPALGIFVEAGMIKLLKHAAEATGRIGVRLSF